MSVVVMNPYRRSAILAVHHGLTLEKASELVARIFQVADKDEQAARWVHLCARWACFAPILPSKHRQTARKSDALAVQSRMKPPSHPRENTLCWVEIC